MSADQLHERLPLDDPAGLLVDSLTPAEAARLHGVVEAARTRRRDDLDGQIDTILKAVPLVVRGRVRKILVGGR